MDKFDNNNDRIQYLNSKQEEIESNQVDTLVLDFDEALKEEEAKIKKVKIVIAGKEYNIPSKMPFQFSTFFLRHCYKKVKGRWTITMQEDKVLPFLEKMLGKKFIMDFENSNNTALSIDFIFTKIVPKIMGTWGIDVNNAQSKFQNEKKTFHK
jgi:hypothetical protein